MSKIEIFCDGACRGNGKEDNIGGWGVVIKQEGGARALSGVEPTPTTNNIMELRACLEAIRAIDPTLARGEGEFILYSDSQYLIKGINEWSRAWKARGWKDVKNVDLWKQVLSSFLSFRNIRFVWRNDSDPDIARADQLANVAMDEYERERPSIPYEDSLTPDEDYLYDLIHHPLEVDFDKDKVVTALSNLSGLTQENFTYLIRMLVQDGNILVKKFRLHWLGTSNQTNDIEGNDIADAFRRAGYGGGIMGALDYWEEIK